MGRQVRLDDLSRVVYSPPSHRQSFAADIESGRLKVLVGNVGIKTVQATGPFRADMHCHWVRLRAFHESLMEHDADALADVAFCVVCGKASKETKTHTQ